MRRLLFFSLTVSALLGMLVLLVMPAGALLNPPPTTLLELAECSYQCWNGIIASQTFIDEVERTMEELHYSRVRRRPLRGGGLATVFTFGECNVVFYYIQLIESVHFQACNRITLGDVILMLGVPDAVIHRNAQDYELRWQNHRGFFVRVEHWSSPYSQPLRITLSAPIDFSIEPKQGRWRGFMSMMGYCALEQPDWFSGC